MTLEAEITAALDKGEWFEFVSGYGLRDDVDESAMRTTATQLHNDGQVNLLAALDGFDEDGDSFRFYEIQQFYSETLPKLDAEPAAMLKAVRRLVKEGGLNRDGGFIAIPFRDWCAQQQRAWTIAELLDFAEPRDGWYLRLAIEGASASDPDGALDWAFTLITGKAGTARTAALEALGSLGNTPERAARAIAELCSHLKSETDDLILGIALLAAVELHGRANHANPTDTAEIIDIAGSRGGAEMRLRAMTALWFQWKAASPVIVDQLIEIAKTLHADETGALGNLDHTLYQMATGKEIERAIGIVRTLLSANHQTLSVHRFSSFEHHGLVAVSCRSLISLSHLGFERERANAAQI